MNQEADSMELNIPKAYIPSFNWMNQAGDRDWNRLMTALENLPLACSIPSFKDRMPRNLDLEAPDMLWEAIYTLGGLFSIEEEELESRVRKLVANFIEHSQDDEAGQKLPLRLKQLIPSLRSVYRAYGLNNLLMDNQTVFIESRIISDIRLLFESDIEIRERMAVVIHQLNLTVSHKGKEEKWSISMNRDTLLSLKSSIERALKKEEHIQEDYAGQINFNLDT